MMISTKCQKFQQNSYPSPISIICWWALLCLLLMTTPTILVVADGVVDTLKNIGNKLVYNAEEMQEFIIENPAIVSLPNEEAKNVIIEETEKMVKRAAKINNELNGATKEDDVILNKAHGELEASVAGAEVALDAVLSQPSVGDKTKEAIHEIIEEIDAFGKKEESKLDAKNVRNNHDAVKPKHGNLKKKRRDDEDEEEPERQNHRTEDEDKEGRHIFPVSSGEIGEYQKPREKIERDEKDELEAAFIQLEKVVKEANEGIDEAGKAATEDNTKKAILKIKERINGFLAKHKEDLTGRAVMHPNSKETGSTQPKEQINKILNNANTKFVEIKEKAFGTMTDANKETIIHEAQTKLTKVEKDAKAKLEELKLMEAAMIVANVKLIKDMGEAIGEVKAKAGIERAQGEDVPKTKKDSEEDSDEREPERIGPASSGEIDEYQRAYHKIKREDDHVCIDQMETSRCRGKMNLCMCKNKAYFTVMKQNCRKTCAHCLPASFVCKDRYTPDCQMWGSDFCVSKFYSKGMIVMQCAKSCGLC